MGKALNDHVYVVVLCGGGGTRLWPLSRSRTPKQFIDLVGRETLFSKTLKRALRLVSPDHVYIMTNKDYLRDVKKVAKKIPSRHIVTEPEKKNTALAMGVIAGIIHHRDPSAVIINLASDHLITDMPAFERAMRAATTVAAKGEHIVTVGIKPTFPHTGYGYIHADGELEKVLGLPILRVEGFREKPDLETAKTYLQSGLYYWNANLYTWAAATILQEFAALSPELSRHIAAIEASVGTPDYQAVLRREYHAAKDEQIDTAISEKTQKLVAIPGDFGWTDVGSWNVVHDEIEKDAQGNALVTREVGAEWLGIDTANSLISTGKKLIVTIGVENLMIVDTKDALLITHKDRAQDVKKVVEHLKENGKKTLL